MIKIINGWFRYLFTRLNDAEQIRLDECNKCPFKKGITCGECGCFIMAKIKCSICECPKGKW